MHRVHIGYTWGIVEPKDCLETNSAAQQCKKLQPCMHDFHYHLVWVTEDAKHEDRYKNTQKRKMLGFLSTQIILTCKPNMRYVGKPTQLCIEYMLGMFSFRWWRKTAFNPMPPHAKARICMDICRIFTTNLFSLRKMRYINMATCTNKEEKKRYYEQLMQWYTWNIKVWGTIDIPRLV